jgi:hypothetical protein
MMQRCIAPGWTPAIVQICIWGKIREQLEVGGEVESSRGKLVEVVIVVQWRL